MTIEQPVKKHAARVGAKSPLANPVNSDLRSEIIDRIGTVGTTIQARKNASLPLAGSGSETCYVLTEGFLILECSPVCGLRRILRLLYPGDFVRASSVPPLNDIRLAAVTPSRVQRCKWQTIDNLIQNETNVANYYHQQLANQEARLALHASIIGGLDAEARVASLLIELALRIGHSAGASVAIELPLARGDMADYLALNPDTFSRIMSRLRAKSAITQTGRDRIFISDWQALLNECPFSPAILSVHGG